jgi:DNA replication protein DnaC
VTLLAAVAPVEAVDVYDHTAEPVPLHCDRCMGAMAWSWWPGRGRHPARWLRPADDQCSECIEVVTAAERDRDITERLRGLGCDEECLPYRADRFLKMTRDETFEAFHARLSLEDRPTIGFTSINGKQARRIIDWRPGRYLDWQGREQAPHWLYVSGRPGSGKTLFVTLLLRALLSVPRTHEEVPVEAQGKQNRAYSESWLRKGLVPPPVLRPHGGWAVHYVHEGELQAQTLAWMRGDHRDTSPMQAAKTAHVLVLDDLGTATSSQAWRQQCAGLIEVRQRRGRPTIITSNLGLGQVAERYQDARMASRIEGLVQGREIELDAKPDWRAMRRSARAS